ncbi:MAG: hypothetical protein ACPIOQ_05470, partial [Promethearchaeia archaeon]
LSRATFPAATGPSRADPVKFAQPASKLRATAFEVAFMGNADASKAQPQQEKDLVGQHAAVCVQYPRLKTQ